MERIAMSQEERDWLDWLKRVQEGQVTQKWAAEKMGVSDRWVRRLLVQMKTAGDAVVVHGLRGRISNRRIDEKIRERAMEIVKSPDWHDFRPTFASEQLAKRHQIQVSKETVRQWMMVEGIWQSKGRKVKEVHQWRPRRSHYGELVQWDTSDHDWLEGRGEPVHHLVRMIDDATSQSWGRFVPRDGTRENMGVLWEYVTRFGRAVDYYTDRDSMFTVAPRPGESKEQQRIADRLTQIGRALRELGIGWIAAYSPQAKGRVERSFLTDQDRLIKELRLAKVKTMQAPTSSWRRNIGRNGTRSSRARRGTKRICIARWEKLSSWVRRSATSSTGSSPTITLFPTTARIIRSFGRMCNRG